MNQASLWKINQFLASQSMNSKTTNLLRRLLLAALLIGVITQIAFPAWKNILNWSVPDNDDAMRILEVRAWLHGQGFYDLINHRLNPPNGGDIHWSRVGDLPLALTEIILRPFLGQDLGEKAAVFITPLWLAFIFASVAAMVVGKMQKGWLSSVTGAFMVLSTAAAMTYFQAGRVDHHGLQIIFALLALWGLISHEKVGAIIAGFAIAMSITIGFETVIIVAIMIIWVALVWGIKGEGWNTLLFTTSLAVSAIIGFFINVPPDRFSITHNDSLTIAQLFPILVGCLLLFLSAFFLTSASLVTRFVALGIIGIVVIATAAQFPILLEKPYYQTSPLLQRLWLNAVTETHPLIKSRPETAITLGMFQVVASIAAIIKLFFVFKNKKRPKYEIENWLLLTVILISLTLLSLFWQLRIAGLAQTFSAIVVAVLFVSLFENNGLLPSLLLLIVINPLVPPTISLIYSKLHPSKSKFAIGGGSSCRGIKAFSHVAALPQGLIASHIDFGAQALLTTHHTVLAAPYHRNQGNMVAYDIFLAKPDKAYELIKNSHVDYLGLCTNSAETAIISRESPQGLMKQLMDKKYPAYLEAVPTPKGSGIIVWKVKK